MLDDVTKKRINTLRQILVGKLPDPKAQVEQITNGLIYKFMNDMDEQSVSMGGKLTYFSGKFQKYSWKNLMDAKMSGVEKIKLYSDAIEQMYINENLPDNLLVIPINRRGFQDLNPEKKVELEVAKNREQLSVT